MKRIGIKLADGTFYPVLKEGASDKKEIVLTTVKDNQTTVKVDIYRSEKSSMSDAEYVDTLKISHLNKQPSGVPTITLKLGLDKDGRLSAELVDKESGGEAHTTLTLLSTLLGNDKNPGTGKGLLGLAEDLNSDTGVTIVEPVEETFMEPVEEELPEASLVEEDFAEPIAAELPEANIVEEMPAESASIDEGLGNDLDLPEFDLPEFGEKSLETEKVKSDDEIEIQDSELPEFDLPDFPQDLSFDEPTTSAQPQSEISQAFGPSEEKLDFSDTDFDMPDFSDTDFSSNLNTDFAKNFDSFEPSYEINNEIPAASDDMDFLFDDGSETEEETSGSNNKIPMIICIICALICILAVAFLLFSSKEKFFKKSKKTETVKIEELPKPVETKIEETLPPIIEQEPIAPVAKEEEVVVAPQAELVVPDLPQEEPTKVNTQEVSYKIKWGDTLWDLCSTYYRNPWVYPKLAKYNNIKNPDRIIAGTYIDIPEEL